MKLFTFCFVCYFTFSISISSALNADGFSLLALKGAVTTDPTRFLAAWSESDTDPCHWPGIACDHDRRVTAVSLSGKGLTGYIPSELGALLSIRHLSLSHNNFSKPIPTHLFNASNLLSLDLSHNSLSGPVLPQISTLQSLTHLDLSSNRLNGSLPECLSNLTQIVGTLNLSYNQFAGNVPASYGLFPVAVSLDLRYNNLTGKIPQQGTLLNQGPTAFTGNPNLCGFPLRTQCPDPEAQNPRISSDPEQPGSRNGVVVPEKTKLKSGSVTVPIISGISVVIGAVFVSAWVLRKRWGPDDGKAKKQEQSEKGVTSPEAAAAASEEEEKGKFVVVDEGFGMELEDLLRASAYVVGKSRSGIVYKVVAGVGGRMGSGGAGVVLAVRRLSEGETSTWRFKDFEAEVEAIGKVQHPNVVRLRAYYYASDEKLLVSDFVSNGSLYTALHGGPANSLPTLSWAARLKIAQGTARGLMHIHESSPRKHVHGNIKTSKILLDDDLQPHISGFGLSRLVSATSKSTNMTSKHSLNQIVVNPKKSSSSSILYVAPEARISHSKYTQKCDVYSFGVVLLEILTGQLPDRSLEDEGDITEGGLEKSVRKAFREERPLSEIIDPSLLPEVQAKKQVVAAFHIALNCTELDPEIRPRMRTVVESLDRVKSV